MKINARVEIMNITPAIATEWLKNRWEGQRVVRPNYGKRLTADMAAGRWRLSCDAILRIMGKVANGQHRLEAVVASGTSHNFIVMESTDQELYKVIDAGLKRTVGDGLGNIEYSKVIPSIARWVQAYDQNQIRSSSRTAADMSKNKQGSSPTQVQLIDYCIDNEELLSEAARFSTGLYMKTRIVPQSIAGAIYVLGSNINQKNAAQMFLQNLFEGGENSSATLLRNRLIASRGSRTRMTKGHLFALTIKAFKNFLKNKTLGVLKVSIDEEFPSLVS